MVIISIMLVFILNAGMDARWRAQERETQALITKLESGLNDRLDALLQTRPDPTTPTWSWRRSTTATHHPAPSRGCTCGRRSSPGMIISRARCPIRFFVQNHDRAPTRSISRPIPTRRTPIDRPAWGTTSCRWGIRSRPTATLPLGDGNLFNPAGTGIYGASYPAAAGIYKNLGYLPTGYDGVNNGRQRRPIDDWHEGVSPARHQAPGDGQPGEPHAQHGAVGDALRPPGRGPGAAGLGLQPRRLHRQGGAGHRPRRPARVRRRLGPAAPVLPLAASSTIPEDMGARALTAVWFVDNRLRRVLQKLKFRSHRTIQRQCVSRGAKITSNRMLLTRDDFARKKAA